MDTSKGHKNMYTLNIYIYIYIYIYTYIYIYKKNDLVSSSLVRKSAR